MTTFGRIVLDGIEPATFPAGLPITGAQLTVFLTGTDTLATIYADAGGTTPILNPQTSNSAGQFYGQSTTIWADSSQAYDLDVVYPAGGTSFYSNVYALGPAPTVTGFAPLNSPAFTGEPTAPTPATNDSSANIATTRFVGAALAAYEPLPSQTGNAGDVLTTNGTVAAWLALANGSQAITGTDSVHPLTAASLFSSAVLAANGYYRFPGGFTIQWGTSPSIASNSSAVVTLPFVFTSACYAVVAFCAASAGSGGMAYAYTTSVGTSSFVLNSAGANAVTFYWIAVGQ